MNFMTIEYLRNLDSIVNVSPNLSQYYLPLNEIYIGISANDSITTLKTKTLLTQMKYLSFLNHVKSSI